MRSIVRSLAAAVLLSLGIACRTASAPPAPSETPSTSPPALQATLPEVGPAGSIDARIDASAAYAQCRERVEGPEADGECSTDADCRAGGCSGEVCATVASMEGMMGTCEVLPCFSVLKECGCREGRCSWSVGEPQPDAGSRPIVLPPRTELPGAATPPSPE